MYADIGLLLIITSTGEWWRAFERCQHRWPWM